MAPQQARRILSRWGDETQRVLGSRRQTCPNLRYLYLTRCWLARGKRSPTAPWGRQGVRPPAPPHTVLQPRLHPNSPRRPHLRTRRACAPLPVAFAPTRPTPEPALPTATPPHPSRHPACRRSRGGVRPRQGSREARRGAQWRRRGPRGLGERSGARGEAQGPCRRDFSRHSGARGAHPDRVPHTDDVFFKLCWAFFSIVSVLLSIQIQHLKPYFLAGSVFADAARFSLTQHGFEV